MSTLQADKGEKAKSIGERAAEKISAYLWKQWHEGLDVSEKFEFAKIINDEIALGEQVEAREQTEGAWRKTSENPPTEKDSSKGHGEVLVETDADYYDLVHWKQVAEWPVYFRHWRPIPPLPAGAPEKKEERK